MFSKNNIFLAVVFREFLKISVEPIPKPISDFISKGISYYFPDHCSIDYIKIQRAVFEFWDHLVYYLN